MNLASSSDTLCWPICTSRCWIISPALTSRYKETTIGALSQMSSSLAISMKTRLYTCSRTTSNTASRTRIHPIYARAFWLTSTHLYSISTTELLGVVPTLWQTTKRVIQEYPQYIPKENAAAFLSDDNGESWSRCCFWTNFEIANLKLWRSEAYMAYFDYLDRAGGFFYER